jgi:hypothetical protein
MALGTSSDSRSQAARGYLNLRRFVLVSSFFIFRPWNDSHKVDKFVEAEISHAE